MSRPIRVFVINAPEAVGGVTWWRMYRPLQLLHRTYPDIEIVHNETGMLYPHHFQYVDVVLCFRPSEPSHVHGIQMAVAAGVPVISDFDDDQINIPVGHPRWADFKDKERYIRPCVAMSTQLWVSTPALVEVYAHPNTVVIPNAVLESDLPQEVGEPSGSVLWRGSEIHREDLEIYNFRGDYLAMLKKIKRFLWVGYMPTWAIVSDSKAQIQLESTNVDTRAWFSYLRQQQLQAIVKPLMVCQFNNAKSNIAWIEATIAGAVCVTNYAGKPGWECAVSKTSPYPDDHAVQVNKSIKEIKKKYNLITWNDVRYREILAAAAGTV